MVKDKKKNRKKKLPRKIKVCNIKFSFPDIFYSGFHHKSFALVTF